MSCDRALDKWITLYNVDATEKKANTRESLEKAKQAVSLDVKDGTSWSKYIIHLF